ncbi:MAG: response regulator [Candidatus Omnitrophota bacterium]
MALEKKKILVVDDEVDIVEILQSRLKEHDYDVVCAFDGEEALLKTRQEKPDLVILDIMLPKMDGYEVCSIIRSEEAVKNIPIVMLTACSRMDNIKKGMDLGAVSYVAKPLKLDVLLGIIKAILP